MPISEKNLPFELTMSFLLTADQPGIPKPIKLQEQHRSVVNLSAPIDEEAGKKLAAWATGGDAPRHDAAPKDRLATMLERFADINVTEQELIDELGKDLVALTSGDFDMLTAFYKTRKQASA